MEQVTLEFPGIGIPEFTLNKIAFSVFGIDVRWYGILITLGVVLAFIYAWQRAKFEKISFDDLLDITFFAVILAMVGARTYYVLTTLKDGIYDSFLDVIAIWNGGIAIYGAIIGGALAVFFVCRHKKIKWQKAFDMASPGVMIGQIIGRWGNFFNGEAYGAEVGAGNPLYFLRMGLIPNIESSSKMYYFHPTFLYESVWNLIGFLIINALYKKKKFDGQVFLMYITWYGFGRMFIEGLRTDSLYVGVFRISQVVGFFCFIVGLGLMIYFGLRSKKLSLATAEGDYNSVYPKLAARKKTNTDDVKDVRAEDTVTDKTETVSAPTDRRKRGGTILLSKKSASDGEKTADDDTEEKTADTDTDTEEKTVTTNDTTEKKDDGDNN